MSPKDLQDALDKRGLSAWQAAKILKTNHSTIWRYLNGSIHITKDRTELIRMRLARYDNGEQSDD